MRLAKRLQSTICSALALWKSCGRQRQAPPCPSMFRLFCPGVYHNGHKVAKGWTTQERGHGFRSCRSNISGGGSVDVLTSSLLPLLSQAALAGNPRVSPCYHHRASRSSHGAIDWRDLGCSRHGSRRRAAADIVSAGPVRSHPTGEFVGMKADAAGPGAGLVHIFLCRLSAAVPTPKS
jgi:hypothetical protein